MKAAVFQPRIIQQPSKWLQPNRPFADMLMPVQLRSARRLGIVAMPYMDILQADRADPVRSEFSSCRPR